MLATVKRNAITVNSTVTIALTITIHHDLTLGIREQTTQEPSIARWAIAEQRVMGPLPHALYCTKHVKCDKPVNPCELSCSHFTDEETRAQS